jgi:hypothetical protein
MFYKALHLSEIWIAENWYGRIDTVWRQWERNVRQLRQQFPYGLSPKMEEAIRDEKWDRKFNIVQVIRPNGEYDAGKWDYRGKPISSITFALDEKWILRRSGYYTMPLLVSRTSSRRSTASPICSFPLMRAARSITR